MPAPVSVAEHNRVLEAAMARADELEGRLVGLLAPILDRAGKDAAAAFQRTATDHLTAAAYRRADRDALLRARVAPAEVGSFALGFRLRPTVLAAAADGVTLASTMVCVKPRPDEAEQLAQDGGQDADSLHVTLCYLGEVEGSLEAVVEALRPVAASRAPLSGVVGGVGIFAPNDEGVGPSILLPDVPGLVELRVAASEALQRAGLDYGREHGFEAHITVDYYEPGSPGFSEPLPMLEPIHFDELLVVRGDVVEASLPLVGPPPLTAAGEPPQWSAPAGDEVLDVHSLVRQLRERTDPVRTALLEATMTATLKQAGLSFDVTNPFTARVLAQAGSHVTNIAATTQLNVMRIIRESYAQGLSIPQTATAIRAGMADASKVRATMIARCLPGETPIDAAVVRAVTRRWYEGDMAVFVTESGREFTATPNHPMLTSRGWRAAGEVEEGEYLVACRRDENPRAPRNEDVADPPPTIAEIFEAAATVGVIERRTGGEPDFHGDGTDGEVDIARPHRELAFGSLAVLYEDAVEDVLAPSDMVGGTRFCARCGHLLAVEKSSCLCGTPCANVCLSEDAPDERVRDAALAANGLNSVSGPETLDDSVRVDVVAAGGGASAASEVARAGGGERASGDPCGNQPVEDGALVRANQIGNPRRAETGDVELDRVVASRLIPYAGYVFNLCTPHGYFTVNGGYTGNTELAGVVNGGSLAATQIVASATGASYVKKWLCVPPGTKVSAAGVIAAVRKPYEGDLVKITTCATSPSSGTGPSQRRFAVTPDHRVLTRRGWIAAGLLRQGDEVVGRRLGERYGLGDPDVDDSEPLIEEVFDAAADRLAAIGMVGTPVHLDNGGIGEKIDVVAADSDLTGRIDVAVPEPLREFMLAVSDVRLDQLLRGSAPLDLPLGKISAAVPVSGEMRFSEQHRGVALVAEPVCLDLGAEPDALLGEGSTNTTLGDGELTGETLHGLAAFVQFDEVLDVQFERFSGHVYDLTTSSGWFFADGYVAHNTAPGAPHPRHELYEDLDGQERALDADFDVGGAALQHPGDPNGPPEEVIQCRCALAYAEGTADEATSGGTEDVVGPADAAEADAFVADSVVKDDLYHYASRADAEQITRRGFTDTPDTRAVVGRGVYLATDEESAALYSPFGDRELLTTKARVANPFVVSPAPDVARASEMMEAALEEQLGKRAANAYAASGHDPQALTDLLRKRGYDSVRVEMPVPDPADRAAATRFVSIGGNQLVVFDAKNVRVVAAGDGAPAVAARMVARATELEPQTTAELSTIASQTGGRMGGLDFAVKTQASLERKIASDMADAVEAGKSPTVAEVAGRINDTLRYTMTFPEAAYTKGVQAALRRLADAGYEPVKIKNYWGNADYQGINAVFEKDGYRFELQFHTPRTFELKTELHLQYEAFRTSADPVERLRLWNEMAAEQVKNAVPADAFSIGQRVTHEPPPGAVVFAPPPSGGG